MSKHRKSWSETEKVSVLQHYYQQGIAATSRHFDVSSSMIYRWLAETKETTTATDSKGVSLADYNRFLSENQSLKELVAEKVLELRVKDALLKKRYFKARAANGCSRFHRTGFY